MRRIGQWTALGLAISVTACAAGPAQHGSGSSDRARQIAAECRSAPEKSACYDEKLAAIAATGAVDSALEVLTALSSVDKSVERDGHMYAHAIGIAAFDPARDFASTFTRCSELFHAGCYHGLIQAHFAGAGQVDAAAVNGLCREVAESGADRWTVFQCLHGIGHGLVILYEHDLIKGLAGCDLLEDAWDRASCHGGAFMENVTNATHPHHAALTAALAGGHDEHASHADHGATAAEPFRPFDRDDLHYPCTIVEEHHKSACYGMQTSVMLYLNEYDFGAAAEACDGAPETYRATCHQSLGRDASGFANRDIKELNRLCAQDRSELAPNCYVGAAKAVIDWAGQPSEGMRFCRAVAGEENRARCYFAVGQQIGVIVSDREKRRAACTEAGGRYRDACLWGAGLLETEPEFLRAKGTP